MLLATAALFPTHAQKKSKKDEQQPEKKKVVVYQVFTRLFGNKTAVNEPWGTASLNGVGKFNDFTDTALGQIKALGVDYIWYTGVPHHALVADYTKYGISNDDPDVVKGRAGSPYAVKDYYNVNPDLAVDPSKRLKEFEDLIKRTHKNGLKLLIDIVPNHVARKYEGKNNPKGVKDFGADDDKSVEYAKNNNFYYIPGQAFHVPDFGSYRPLGGEKHSLSDGKFAENPTKWTGNGSRNAKPSMDDWYETVKVNYGVKPDGTKDFPELPESMADADYTKHFAYWKPLEKELPDSWIKFKDIALYWIDKGVDGFRYDMAEMVPYEFWSYLNSNIKMKNPDAFLLAEVYNPAEYRNYIRLGKMDYLYDKVELYDKLKHVIQGHSNPDGISDIQLGLADIEHHMLHFLENHDEQRIASPEFAGNAHKGKPMMVLSAAISTSPTMMYFGQEVGEMGAEKAGFGSPSRTSIFDYIGVPAHQRWMNEGSFDGGKLNKDERSLIYFYHRLLNVTRESDALMGKFIEIQKANRTNKNYPENVYSFVRASEKEQLIVACNFSGTSSYHFELVLPIEVIKELGLADGRYQLKDLIFEKSRLFLNVSKGVGKVGITLAPSESFMYKILK